MRPFLPVLLVFSLVISSSLAFAADDDSKSADTDSQVAAVDDAASKLTKEELTQLELLENHFFGRVHPSELLTRRVERLERFVFGTEGSGTEYGARLDKLSATLSTVDPDGKKRVISIAPPPAPPEPGLPSAVSGIPPGTAAANATSSNTTIPSQLPAAITDVDQTTANDGSASQASSPAPGGDNGSDYGKTKDDFYKVASKLPANNQPSLAGQVKTELRQSEAAGVLHCNSNLFPIDGEPSKVVHELTVAIKVHPLDPDLMFERAKAEMLLDRIDSALSDLSDAIMNNPNRSLYYLARAWCYKRSGNSVLANDDLKQAKFVDPGLPAKIDFLPATANSEAAKTQ